MRLRAVEGQKAPENEPDHPESTEEVEDGLPADLVAEEAGDGEGNDGAELGPAEGERGQTTSLTWWSPPAVQYNTEQYTMIQCSAMQYRTLHYDTIQCNTITYGTKQYRTI